MWPLNPLLRLAGPGSNNWVQANPPWLCGTITSPGEPQPLHGKGYLCPADQGQFCTSAVGDPNYGMTGFDNLGQTALLMIQASLLRSSYEGRCCAEVSEPPCCPSQSPQWVGEVLRLLTLEGSACLEAWVLKHCHQL